MLGPGPDDGPRTPEFFEHFWDPRLATLKREAEKEERKKDEAASGRRRRARAT